MFGSVVGCEGVQSFYKTKAATYACICHAQKPTRLFLLLCITFVMAVLCAIVIPFT